MDLLKKLFPITAKGKDLTSLIIAIVIYVVIGVIGGVILGFFGGIPVVKILAWIIGTLLEIYTLGGIIISVLDFLEIKF